TSLSFLQQCPPIKPNFLQFHFCNSRQLTTITVNIKPYFFNSSNFPPKFSSSCTKFNSPISILHDSSDLDSIFPQFPNPNFLTLLKSFLPGGTWWNLRDSQPLVAPPSNSPLSKLIVFYALRRIWGLISRDKLVVFSAFASLTIAAIAEISIPNLLAVCIFSAQNGENSVFYRSSQLLVMLCITSGVCSGIRGYCFGVANMILVTRLRETLYSVILHQDVSFFDTEAVGTLSSRLGSDCQRLSRVIGNDLHLIFRNILQGGGALLNLVMLSQPLALSALAICFILSAIFLVYGPYQKKAAKVTQDLEACANEVRIKLLSNYESFICSLLRLYQHWLNKLIFVNTRESAAYGLWNLSFATLYRSTQIIAVIFGGLSVIAGQLSSEQLTKYILYCEWLIYATWRLADSCSSLLQSVGASEKLFQLMDLRPSCQFSCKGFEVQQLRGDIEFVKVSFRYPTRTQALVVDSVSMHLRANEVIAIVGPSGSGKSTLAKLLLRLYEPADGEILVDGYHLKDVDVKWLRRKIGYVGQEPRLFHMDVKSNITYGCHGDIIWEDVEWAAKLAHAHDFILSLPKGYDTLIDDDVLSGGQKQRIAIARAILRNPAILVLDEPTSALDTESEQYITEVLNSLRLQFRKTIIIITHRLSTVTTADRIYVMDGGKIVEMVKPPSLARPKLTQGPVFCYAKCHARPNSHRTWTAAVSGSCSAALVWWLAVEDIQLI
ncbi:hypothetical protein KSS87_002568, partial [Heliosperma pusillum]